MLYSLDIPNEVYSTINFEINYETNNYFIKDEKIKHDDLLHPSGNDFRENINYPNLKIKFINEKGDAIFLKMRLLDVKKDHDFIYIDGKIKDTVIYIAKVEYSVIFKIELQQNYTLYEKPKIMLSNWLIVLDNNDGKYKLYDFVPSPKIFYFGINSFFEAEDFYKNYFGDNNDYQKIRNLLLKYKK
jgi:hypothetical protein